MRRLMNVTRIIESFTTIPVSATSPIIERIVSGKPITKWPTTAPIMP